MHKEKIGFTNLKGNFIKDKETTVNKYEAMQLGKCLEKRFDVDYLTATTSYDKNSKLIYVDENYDINQYDKLFVVNTMVNFFGGGFIESYITIYKLLHKFKGTIYYMLTDSELPLKDLWPAVRSKKWNIWKEDDFSINCDVVILSQLQDLSQVKKLHKHLNIKDIIYVPLAQWIIETQSNNMILNNNFNKDLIYGGTFRSGRRESKMIEYLFNRNLNVEIFGTIKRDNFNLNKVHNEPIFSGKVKCFDVVDKNSTSLSTIIFGDNIYNNNNITLRVWEALMSSAVAFIDNDFDTYHNILNDSYFYVNNGKELEDKILQLKSDNELYKIKKQQQFDVVKNYLNNNKLIVEYF